MNNPSLTIQNKNILNFVNEEDITQKENKNTENIDNQTAKPTANIEQNKNKDENIIQHTCIPNITNTVTKSNINESTFKLPDSTLITDKKRPLSSTGESVSSKIKAEKSRKKKKTKKVKVNSQIPADLEQDLASALDDLDHSYKQIFSHEYNSMIDFFKDTYTSKVDTKINDLYTQRNLNKEAVVEMLRKMYKNVRSSKLKYRITKIVNNSNKHTVDYLQTETETSSNDESDKLEYSDVQMTEETIEEINESSNKV